MDPRRFAAEILCCATSVVLSGPRSHALTILLNLSDLNLPAQFKLKASVLRVLGPWVQKQVPGP